MAAPQPQPYAYAGKPVSAVMEGLLDPNIQARGAMLPLGLTAEGDYEFALPQIGVDMVRSALLPGHVWQGGAFDTEDATNFTLDTMAGGSVASLAAPNPASLGMNAAVKLPKTPPKAPPQKTVKAYKLFRVDPDRPGELFPLYVDADKPVPMGEWVNAEIGGAAKSGKVKSKIGELAMRPGWHAGDLPMATHIGGKVDFKTGQRMTGKGVKPTAREPNQVWAEVEMPADFDWQSVADSRASVVKSGPREGLLNSGEAHITDQLPHSGHYRYKTNPNMTGEWLISGQMKVNRILGDDEVTSINSAAGFADLPRYEPRVGWTLGANRSPTAGLLAAARYRTPEEHLAATVQMHAANATPTRADVIADLTTKGNIDKAPFSPLGQAVHVDDALAMEGGVVRQDVGTNLFQPRALLAPDEIFRPGDVVTRLGGDLSDVGHVDMLMDEVIDQALQGGVGYIRNRGTGAWASHDRVIENLLKLQREYQKSHPDARFFGVSAPMTAEANLFNNMVGDIYTKLVARKPPTKTNAKKIDVAFRKALRAKTAKGEKKIPGVDVKTFPGINDPDFGRWFAGVSGTSRSALLKAVNTKKNVELGLPDLNAINMAVTRPDARWVRPTNDPLVGQSIGLFDPAAAKRAVAETADPHGTYPTDLLGSYAGEFDVWQPQSLVFPDFDAAKRAELLQRRTITPRNVASATAGSYRTSKIGEVMTQEKIDNMMKWREQAVQDFGVDLGRKSKVSANESPASLLAAERERGYFEELARRGAI